ncbi:MAG: ABC transporter permease [Candidatus Coproplasma sp.]
MKRCFAFVKRNSLEMLRDPLIYVFCLGFPVIMLLLFEVINACTPANLAIFEAKSLVPGIMLFSFTFVMLMESILVSKDRSTAFLIRLYSSPMKTKDYVIGYALPCFVVGVVQEVVCILFGWILSLIFGGEYFPFGSAMLLVVEMLPMLITFIFLGILFGSVLNDKSAPGICSALICAAGILGGCWMPLDTMGGFETVCRVLPFYPSVYIGRVITGATHTMPDELGQSVTYTFDSVASLGLIPIAVVLVLAVVLSLVAFRRNMTSDKR